MEKEKTDISDITKLKQLEYHRKYRETNIENRRKWNKEWIENNREKYNAQKAKYRDNTKIEVFTYYGKWNISCVICWFNNLDWLCLDHINNDWNEHRKQMWVTRRVWINTYEKLRKDWYPEWIQILCANCNQIKEVCRKREIRLENKFYNKFYAENNSTP